MTEYHDGMRVDADKNLDVPRDETADELKHAQSVQELRYALQDMANQLDAWAQSSIDGGWSTHQVSPMRKRADDLRRLAAKYERRDK